MIDDDSCHLFKRSWPGAELLDHIAQGTLSWVHPGLCMEDSETCVSFLMIHAKVVEANDSCKTLHWITIAQIIFRHKPVDVVVQHLFYSLKKELQHYYFII